MNRTRSNAVWTAWNDLGQDPKLHRSRQEELIDEWPQLGRSLQALQWEHDFEPQHGEFFPCSLESTRRPPLELYVALLGLLAFGLACLLFFQFGLLSELRGAKKDLSDKIRILERDLGEAHNEILDLRAETRYGLEPVKEL